MKDVSVSVANVGCMQYVFTHHYTSVGLFSFHRLSTKSSKHANEPRCRNGRIDVLVVNSTCSISSSSGDSVRKIRTFVYFLTNFGTSVTQGEKFKIRPHTGRRF